MSDRLGRQKLSLEERLRFLDTVSEEKQRFEKSGLLPWSEPMLPFLARYLEMSRAAETKVMEDYNKNISQALQAKDSDKVADLRAELKSLMPSKVVARWKHTSGNNSGVVLFYANGKIR